MGSPLESLIRCGTKLWIDSIDPELVKPARQLGATGATSNPIIVSDIVKSGICDARLGELARQGQTDEAIAWQLTDGLVRSAQEVFVPVHDATRGNDGYVSFELDPLLEDAELAPAHGERVERYVELGREWSAGHRNRMIKVPATPAGLDALEDLAAAGVTLNVTLIFSPRQYRIAREAVWRGAQRRADRDGFKSVYSIHRERQADLAGELRLLVRQGSPAAAGDDLREHRDQEAAGPAGQVRLRVGSTRCRLRPSWTRSIGRSIWRGSKKS
jgi:transaldolase